MKDEYQFELQACTVTSVGSLNFSLGYAKLVTPKGKNQYTLRKL